MAQTRTPTHRVNQHGNIPQSQSMLNVSELETHVKAKATVQDIDELYAALQGLVPKRHHNGKMWERTARPATSATDTGMTRSCENLGPSRFRRHRSERYSARNTTDNNMNLIEAKQNKPFWEKPEPTNVDPEKTPSTLRLFVSDTELQVHNTEANERKALQKQLSLPACQKDEETIDQTDGSHKKSKFLIFHRQRGSKPAIKKQSSWRSLLSTLSFHGKKPKKHSNNKVGYTANPAKNQGKRTPKTQAKNKSLPIKDPNSEMPLRSSVDGITTNSTVEKSGKRIAPDPPEVVTSHSIMETLHLGPQRKRSDAFGQMSDLVQKKISAWYKHAVMETNSVPAEEPLRVTRCHENLLTDTEVIRKRNAFSSDTDSFSCGDKNRVSVPRTKVRKTRARRNRRRERARFYSCPNVKLVMKALNETENKTKLPEGLNSSENENPDDNSSQACYITTVKPVEAKLSFGNTLENEESDTDIIKLQNINARNWLTRQCSKTTISCIRPLQLNLFYSESPSRETVHRSRQSFRKSRMDGQTSSAVNQHEFAFKIRRLSSRRRKRRSFKRGQTRLPHQSPFYVPPNNLNLTPKPKAEEEECSTFSKDYGTFRIMTRDQRQSKRHSESEDSGWASSHRHLANTSDTGIQTDPVIVMTADSRIRSTRTLPHALNDNNDESES